MTDTLTQLKAADDAAVLEYAAARNPSFDYRTIQRLLAVAYLRHRDEVARIVAEHPAALEVEHARIAAELYGSPHSDTEEYQHALVVAHAVSHNGHALLILMSTALDTGKHLAARGILAVAFGTHQRDTVRAWAINNTYAAIDVQRLWNLEHSAPEPAPSASRPVPREIAHLSTHEIETLAAPIGATR